MKKKHVAVAALAVFAVLVLSAAVGMTVAYLNDQTPSLEEHFVPVEVNCEVKGANGDYTSNILVENTGDITAYIRAAVVVTWVSETDGTTYGGGPILGTHYTLTEGEGGWVKGSDGFYYCTDPVAAGQRTPILVSAVTPIEGQEPTGYRLAVQVLASALQANPKEAVIASWSGVTVAENGSLIPQ